MFNKVSLYFKKIDFSVNLFDLPEPPATQEVNCKINGTVEHD